MKKIKNYKNYKDTILESQEEVEEIPEQPVKKQIVIIHGGDAYSEYGAFANHNEYLNKLRNYNIGNAADRYRVKRILDLEKLKLLVEEDKLGWMDWLANNLPEDYDVFVPSMPTPPDAVYEEWKVWFEKLLPYINKDTIFIGHSLGGIFLTKYFSENDQSKIKALILLAAPIRFGESGFRGGFILNSRDVPNLGKIKDLYFLQSKNDKCVPYTTVHKYKKLIPSAKLLIFQHKGHFNMTVFPELLNLIINKIK